MSDSMNNTAAAAATYKKLKEEFVSGLSGGTVSEICAVTLVAPVSVLLWSVLQSRQSFFKPYTPLGSVVDFLLNVGAILLAITLYAGSPLVLNGLLLAATLFVYALPPSTGGRRKKPRVPPAAQVQTGGGSTQAKSASAAAGATGGQQQQRHDLPLKPFVTTYRGCMLVITALAILAVDFRLFPRRFAKVETWGTSLMDIGVGSFVFAAGLVAARPVLRERAAAAAGRPIPSSLGRRLLGSVRHALPLLALGLVRLLSVKGLDYAEHVTEYGVHWNFFFTLGLLPPFVAASQSALALAAHSHAALALALAAAYQVALESTSLKAYILAAPRTDLLSMNREGVFSFVGYLAIFLAGQDAGIYILPRGGSESRRGRGHATKLPLTMAISSAAWVALYLAATDYRFGAGLSVSRRLANLPYVLGVVSFNMVQMLAFCLVDVLCFPSPAATTTAADPKAERDAYETATSRVLRAYNRNGLFVFLVANLLTGLVNMTVPTLDVGPVATMGILVGYAAAVTVVAVGLDMYDISIKL